MVRLMRWVLGMFLASCASTFKPYMAREPGSKSRSLKGISPDDDLATDWDQRKQMTITSRHLLQFSHNQTCTPPSINEFPPDLFTQEQRANGALIFHFLLGIYFCYGLAAVCDTYFVPSLEILSNQLGLSSDVAGATFMAAGTSSPELFESIIGSFITEGDIGVGTIVGSAVFNILAVTSVCGILTGMVVPLDWWPLTRDCAFYAVTVVALVIMIEDERIYWYESTVLLVMFVFYLLLMRYNTRLAAYMHSKAWWSVGGAIDHAKFGAKVATFHDEEEEYEDDDSATESTAVDLHKSRHRTLSDNNSPTSSNSADLVRQTAIAIANDVLASNGKTDATALDPTRRTIGNNNDVKSLDTLLQRQTDSQKIDVNGTVGVDAEELEEDSEDEWGPTLFPSNRNVLVKFSWIVTWPMNFLLYCTVPNCNKQRWKRFYPLTFLMSVLYIGSMSYFVAWMVTVIGYTIGVPDTVMGITFLAIGTSVPEGYSSVIVCRKGYGNMAISNSVGSNVFDILICLGLPWLIKAAAFSTTGYVQINSSGLLYSTISLLATVVALYLTIVLFKFKLNMKVGITCLLLYSIFLTFASLVELNVFGVVNPPLCPELDL